MSIHSSSHFHILLARGSQKGHFHLLEWWYLYILRKDNAEISYQNQSLTVVKANTTTCTRSLRGFMVFNFVNQPAQSIYIQDEPHYFGMRKLSNKPPMGKANTTRLLTLFLISLNSLLAQMLMGSIILNEVSHLLSTCCNNHDKVISCQFSSRYVIRQGCNFPNLAQLGGEQI